MNTHEFIFSGQLKYRIGRHLVFWTLFSLHFIIQNLMIGGPGEAKTSRTFLESASHFLENLIPAAIPNNIKGKNNPSTIA